MTASEDSLQLFSQRIVVVGSSTGGTEAIKVLLSGMPGHAPPILIAQHMPQSFTRSFVERLDSLCKMRVKEAEHQEKIRAGTGFCSARIRR